jgi:hypothetical protein
MKIECPKCYAELDFNEVVVDTKKLKNVDYYQQQLNEIQKLSIGRLYCKSQQVKY